METRPINIARWRLESQRLDGRPLRRPVDVVRWLVASQAQDFAGAKWALGLRTVGATDAEVERAFDEGAILRTHMMRPTWHFVARENIRWMLALTAPRVNALSAYRYRPLELDAGTFRKTNAALARVLRGRQLTRDEIRQALAAARAGTFDGERLAHVMMRAELDGVVCSGARRGKQFTYALLDERAPRARTLSRDEALTELTRRYFTSRGPATVQDFSKWSGLTVADARNGLEEVGSTLRRDVVEGKVYWSADAPPARRRGAPTAHLLSIYDEYMSAYQDRSAMCDPAHAKRLVGMGNALAYVVLVNGQIAGTWRRTFDRRTIRLHITPLRTLNAAERRAVDAAAARFARFVGGDCTVTTGRA
jgi:winged helix DNA-binding protein